MLICDTSGLVAYFDRSDRHHRGAASVVDADPGPFVVSPYVLAELDYLLATHRGATAELAALRELSGGAWALAHLGPGELATALGVMERYADQALGLADASIAVLADRFDTDRLLTLDHRHFGVVRTTSGGTFTLLP